VTDRAYWHVPGARSWHALQEWGTAMGQPYVKGFCGRRANAGRTDSLETVDRLPPDAHLCGSCARVIAARTDLEEDRAAVAEDIAFYSTSPNTAFVSLEDIEPPTEDTTYGVTVAE
jgi:hypothetical protein